MVLGFYVNITGYSSIIWYKNPINNQWETKACQCSKLPNICILQCTASSSQRRNQIIDWDVEFLHKNCASFIDIPGDQHTFRFRRSRTSQYGTHPVNRESSVCKENSSPTCKSHLNTCISPLTFPSYVGQVRLKSSVGRRAHQLTSLRFSRTVCAKTKCSLTVINPNLRRVLSFYFYSVYFTRFALGFLPHHSLEASMLIYGSSIDILLNHPPPYGAPNPRSTLIHVQVLTGLPKGQGCPNL